MSNNYGDGSKFLAWSWLTAEAKDMIPTTLSREDSFRLVRNVSIVLIVLILWIKLGIIVLVFPLAFAAMWAHNKTTPAKRLEQNGQEN